MESAKVEGLISEFISKMTLEEKVAMCHGDTRFTSPGVERLGIPPLRMSDGPHGIREEIAPEGGPAGWTNDACSFFTCTSALAATWNPEIAGKFGVAIGEEARAREKDVLLAPGINIMRAPLCGRNFEYYSEDPYLITKLVVPFIKGVQSQDVAACIKHFVANNQETNRFTVNVEIDERTLREIYIPGFEAAIREGQVYTAMGAYNQFRGQHCCHNEYLLNKVLKEDWEFDGVVISDWAGVHDTIEAANNGLDIEMGSRMPFDEYYLAKPYLEALKSGAVSVSTVDEKVRRILRLMFKLKMFDENRIAGSINTPEHQQMSLNIAREGIVLLKNENGILPLDDSKVKSIAVIGDNAERLHAYGGVSSAIKALYEISPLQGLKNRLGDKVIINLAKGYAEEAEDSSLLVQEAVDAASHSDIAIVFAGLNHNFDTECKDREDMKLPYGQDELIHQVYKANPNTVVVLVSASPVEMNPWVDSVQGIVQAWYCGMECGNAIAEVLFGDVNPSGKLPVTFPVKLEDSPVYSIGEFPGDETVNYREGIFVGYRYFDTYKVEPLFCFGHGLSYTTFEYSDLEITPYEGEHKVSFSVTNTGTREGAEIAQLYIRDVVASVPRPAKELKGFEKVFLNSGEKKTVSLVLDRGALSYYDVDKKAWVTEPGAFEVLVGSSSHDVRLKGSFEV